MAIKLIKVLSNLKYGSRKEISKLIKQSRILVNNTVVKSDNTVVEYDDLITINNEDVYLKENIYLIMNKPKNYVSANSDSLHKTVIDLLPSKYSRYDLSICGRLDIDTTGLLILTTDGELTHKIIHPKKNVTKKYKVTLSNPLINYEILEKGIEIKDGKNQFYKTQESKIEIIDEYNCFISIKEGKFHQVKRMFEYIDNTVIELERVSIGSLQLTYLEKNLYKETSKEFLEDNLFN